MSINKESKICSSCKLDKLINCFSLDKSTKDGYSFYCKECKKTKYEKNHPKKIKIPSKDKYYESKRKWRLNNKEFSNLSSKLAKTKRRTIEYKEREINDYVDGRTLRWLSKLEKPGTKICRICGQCKSVKEYNINLSGRLSVESSCKVCRNAYWNSRTEDQRKLRREKLRKDYPKNRERILHNSKIHNAKRRSLIQAAGSYTLEQWNKLKEITGNRCLCCLISEIDLLNKTGIGLTRDHIEPLTRGGSNTIHNIQPLCLTCNQVKNVKTIDYRTPDKFI